MKNLYIAPGYSNGTQLYVMDDFGNAVPITYDTMDLWAFFIVSAISTGH